MECALYCSLVINRVENDRDRKTIELAKIAMESNIEGKGKTAQKRHD